MPCICIVAIDNNSGPLDHCDGAFLFIRVFLMIALWESAAIVCLKVLNKKIFHYIDARNLNLLPAVLGKQVLLSLEFQELFSAIIGKQLTSESINIQINYSERTREILNIIIRY